jgi:hypothetical protein
MVAGRRVSPHDVPENSFRASTAVLAAKAECNAPPDSDMRHFLTFRCRSNLRNLWIFNLRKLGKSEYLDRREAASAVTGR